MAHLGTKDEDWANCAYPNEPVDLFYCEGCDIDFSIKNKKLKRARVRCPLCNTDITAHTKDWRH